LSTLALLRYRRHEERNFMANRTIFECKECGVRFCYFHHRVLLLPWNEEWGKCVQSCPYQLTCPYTRPAKKSICPACSKAAKNPDHFKI
jgi:hypothetical protein